MSPNSHWHCQLTRHCDQPIKGLSPMMEDSRFLGEIIDIIIDIHKDALGKCTLVCKSWLPMSLFHSIAIQSPHKAEQLRQLLRAPELLLHHLPILYSPFWCWCEFSHLERVIWISFCTFPLCTPWEWPVLIWDKYASEISEWFQGYHCLWHCVHSPSYLWIPSQHISCNALTGKCDVIRDLLDRHWQYPISSVLPVSA